jgi:hypothetical protein
MQSNNQIVLQTADNANMSLALGGLTQQLFQFAAENINSAISDADGWSDLEKRAMIAAEALRLTKGFDLTAIITRGQIIQQIEHEGLVSVHPNGFADLTALAREQGISVSVLSDTRALCEHIFPYITSVLGRTVVEVWDAIGLSNMRELVPALRSLITGEDAAHGSVRTAVETLLNNAAVELVAGGAAQDELTTEDVQRRAIEGLLEAGATLPNRELRRTVRPTRTPEMNAATLQTADEEWFAVVKITSRDQYDLLMRQFGTHVNNMQLNGRSRQAETLINTIRTLFGG